MLGINIQAPSLPASSLYIPRYSRKRYLLGIQPNKDNCIAWVCLQEKMI